MRNLESAGRTALAGLALVAALLAGTVAAATAAQNAAEPGPASPDMRIAQLGPIHATPYRWSVSKTADGSIVLKGYVPDSATQARLFQQAGAHALDASSVARGEPDGFAGDAETALSLVMALDEGSAELFGADWRLSGRAGSRAAAAQIETTIAEDGLLGRGWLIDVRAAEAEAEAEKSAPPQDMTAMADTEDEMASAGAQETAAGELDETPSKAGAQPASDDTASSQAEAAPVTSSDGSPPVDEAAEAVPETAEHPAPPATLPFAFAASKQGDRWLVGGNAPIDAFQRLVDIHLGIKSHGRLSVTAAPEGFGSQALAALDILKTLESGRLMFDGTTWSLSGVAADAQSAAEARKQTTDQGVAGEISVAESRLEPDAGAAPDKVDFADLGLSTEPPVAAAPPPLPLPTANPFRWQAHRNDDGTLDFDGYLPTESLQRYLDVRSGGGTDTTSLAAGAPETFAADVLAGVNALAELQSGDVGFDGKDWTLTGNAADAAAKARLLAGLGPRAERWSVAVSTPEPPPPPEARPEPPPPFDKGVADYAFSAEKQAGGAVVLSGDVPAAATRAYLAVLAGGAATDTLDVRDGAPEDFVPSAVTGLRALAGLDSGQLVYKDFAWRFDGKSARAPARDTAKTLLASVPQTSEWSIDIVAPTPLEVCTAEVAAFDERNAILFDAGSSRITRDSLPALDEIAVTLETCPEATVRIEGHTDSDGDDESNLILSVSRAEAVVDKLIALGVGEERLYAIGYGESLPIASNDTQDGKRRNRRIVFSVTDGGE